jgi:hypothetical protein
MNFKTKITQNLQLLNSYAISGVLRSHVMSYSGAPIIHLLLKTKPVFALKHTKKRLQPGLCPGPF